MTRRAPLAFAVLFLPTLPGGPAAEGLRFAPAEGTTVTKTFQTSGSFESADVVIEVGGQDEVPEISLDAEWTRTITIEDTYESAADGRPTKLTRKFETVAHRVEGTVDIETEGETVNEQDGSGGESALEGETVVFVWDAESGEYRKAFDDDEADPDLLDGLTEDMDLRALLPSEDTSQGDRWDVDGDALVSVFLPGGELSIEVDVTVSDRRPIAAGIEPWMYTDLGLFLGAGDSLEVDATCTFAGEREEDGSTLIVVEIEFEISGEADLVDEMADRLDEIGDQIPAASVIQADFEFTLDGGGTLIWNSSAGHVHGLELKAETVMELDRILEIDDGGESMEVTTMVVLEGELTHELQTR